MPNIDSALDSIGNVEETLTRIHSIAEAVKSNFTLSVGEVSANLTADQISQLKATYDSLITVLQQRAAALPSSAQIFP